MTHENFQEDLLASLRKRARMGEAQENLIADTPVGPHDFADSKMSGFGIDNRNVHLEQQKQTIQ